MNTRSLLSPVLLAAFAAMLAGAAPAPTYGVCALDGSLPAPDGQCFPYATDARVDAFLTARESDYRRALAGARAWLEPLRVDPAALRQDGIKGKKKLVELIDAWVRLHAIADEGERRSLLAHIDELAAVTRTDAYHDMLEIDDLAFRQDATSYLRAAYLLDRLELDTARYRSEIAQVRPRLDAHMRSRGPNQRAVFHVYYGWFGLPEPFPLGQALADGLIAARVEPRGMEREQVYAVTHEVFAPYDFGEDLDATPFTDPDLRYLRRALPELTRRFVAERDADLVAELVSCMRYIRALDLPEYTLGLAFLLDAQHADGHWGDYASARAVMGDRALYQLELHTTAVAIDALTVAFHPGWNQDVSPDVPPPG